MSTLAWAMLAAPPLLPLAMTALNLATWTRGKSGHRWEGRVSVLIPARNEEENIEACVRAVAMSRHPVHEIVVYNDQSTDGTRAILRDLKREIPTLRVARGFGVPDGWIGKPHACHQLAKRATGDLLVFVDADTRVTPEGIERLVSCLLHERAGIATAAPKQEMVTWSERWLIPILLLTYTSWFPLVLVAKNRDPRFVAANGQLLAVRRETYDALGGFGAIRHEIVDDVAFCRHAKERGERVVFADGDEMATCRMYTSIGDLWRGFSKNIYEGIGGTPLALAITLTLYFGVFVAPYAALVAAIWIPAWLAPALVGVAANMAVRVMLVVRHRHPLFSVLVHPLAVVAALALAVTSFRSSRRGALEWAGRTYAPRSRRLEVTL